jgi:hydrogenase expression/formation protein HypC
MKIVRIEKNTATVEAGSVSHEVRTDLIRGPRVNDYVLVHAGFAIEKIDEGKARELIKKLEQPDKI